MRTNVAELAACLVVSSCSGEPATGPPASATTCTELGCDSSFTITLPTSLSGAYVVTLAGGSWSQSFPCPASDGMLDLDGGGYYPYHCDATSFVLLWPGGGVPDGGPGTLSYDVTITATDGGVVVPQTTAVGTLSSTYQPNGPQCGPTCLAFAGPL